MFTMRGLVVSALLVLLSAAGTFVYQGLLAHQAIADHVAEARIHQPIEVLEQRMERLEKMQEDFEEETRDNWLNQGEVNTEVLRGLSKIQGHLGIQ